MKRPLKIALLFLFLTSVYSSQPTKEVAQCSKYDFTDSKKCTAHYQHVDCCGTQVGQCCPCRWDGLLCSEPTSCDRDGQDGTIYNVKDGVCVVDE